MGNPSGGSCQHSNIINDVHLFEAVVCHSSGSYKPACLTCERRTHAQFAFLLALPNAEGQNTVTD